MNSRAAATIPSAYLSLVTDSKMLMITGSAPAALADRDLYTKSSVRPWLASNVGVEERVVEHFQDAATVAA